MTQVTIEQRVDHKTLRSPEPRPMFAPTQLYRVQLAPGFQLYKLTGSKALSGNRLATRPSGFVTPWWFSYEHHQAASPDGPVVSIPGVDSTLLRANRADASFTAFSRSRGAVNKAWNNPMDHILIVRLNRPTLGLYGRCSAQMRSADHNNVKFIGGAMQLFIDGLAPRDVRIVGLQSLE